MPLLGRVAVCVGATNGIGRAIAVALARKRARVVVVGRSLEAGATVAAELNMAYPDGGHYFISVDCSLMKNIRNLVVKGRPSPLPMGKINYLVLTQGIATLDGRAETPEGIDRKLALHYYGRILFARLLLPQLQMEGKGDSAVLSVLSAGVHSAYTNFDDLELKKNFSLKNAADAAGFYNDLALDALARDAPNVSFCHAAPGMVATNWGSEFPKILRYPLRFLQSAFAATPNQCAEQMIAGVLARRAGCLHLFGPKGEDVLLTQAHTADRRIALWSHTLRVLEST
jgi:NAD(P)-dependent dehydrogenase (short-subunit alcohol dehydrogenase family)